MTLEGLYYISQIVAVGAIFASLVYVAIQTRQNGRLMRAKAVWDAQTSFAEINDTLANGGPVSQIIYKTLTNPENLTDYERYQVQRHIRGLLLRIESQYALYRKRILDEEVWHLRRDFFSGLLNSPLFKEIWEADKRNSVFTHDFIAEMDKAGIRAAQTLLGVRATEKGGKEPA